jgi:hypothetical protein
MLGYLSLGVDIACMIMEFERSVAMIREKEEESLRDMR